MNDIFGREVKKGDIIALTTQSSHKGGNYQTYIRTRLGIVVNILPKRQWKKGSYNYNRVLLRHNNTTYGGNIQIALGLLQVFSSTGQAAKSSNTTLKVVPGSNDPDYYEVMEKITIVPFEETGAAFKHSKNGKMLYHPLSSNHFLIVDSSTLNDQWKHAYDKTKQLLGV